jgi:hypothetical protein
MKDNKGVDEKLGRKMINIPPKRALVPHKNKILTLKLSIKSPCLHPLFGLAFTPLGPFSVVSAKQGDFIKSEYEMLETQHLMDKVAE